METVQKVITIVCTGNSCRSPMAEYLLTHALQGQPSPLDSVRVISAGVAAYPGDPASDLAIKAMAKVKIDLSGHRTRPLSPQLLEISDLVLTMTSGHLQTIQHRYPDIEVPIFRFREWVSGGSQEVPDPFGGSLDDYLETRDSLAEAIPSIITFLKNHFSQ